MSEEKPAEGEEMEPFTMITQEGGRDGGPGLMGTFKSGKEWIKVIWPRHAGRPTSSGPMGQDHYC